MQRPTVTSPPPTPARRTPTSASPTATSTSAAVQPSVDTTYAGRYRVGNGPWRTIPDTLTVPGTAVDLQVVSATPHLVGY